MKIGRLKRNEAGREAEKIESKREKGNGKRARRKQKRASDRS